MLKTSVKPGQRETTSGIIEQRGVGGWGGGGGWGGVCVWVTDRVSGAPSCSTQNPHTGWEGPECDPAEPVTTQTWSELHHRELTVSGKLPLALRVRWLSRDSPRPSQPARRRTGREHLPPRHLKRNKTPCGYAAFLPIRVRRVRTDLRPASCRNRQSGTSGSPCRGVVACPSSLTPESQFHFSSSSVPAA